MSRRKNGPASRSQTYKHGPAQRKRWREDKAAQRARKRGQAVPAGVADRVQDTADGLVPGATPDTVHLGVRGRVPDVHAAHVPDPVPEGTPDGFRDSADGLVPDAQPHRVRSGARGRVPDQQAGTVRDPVPEGAPAGVADVPLALEDGCELCSPAPLAAPAQAVVPVASDGVAATNTPCGPGVARSGGTDPSPAAAQTGTPPWQTLGRLRPISPLPQRPAAMTCYRRCAGRWPGRFCEGQHRPAWRTWAWPSTRTSRAS
jgi:hypothetical protein